MKIQSQLLTLFVFAAETNAFFAPSPKLTSSKLHVSANFGNPAGNDGELARPSQTAMKAAVSSPPPTKAGAASAQDIQKVWEESTPITVQGGSLRTWSFMSAAVERVQVILKTEGRPLNADVELWQGPDNTPQKMAVYLEDGDLRPFCAVIESPRGSNTVAVRNTAHMEFPLAASVEPDIVGVASPGLAAAAGELYRKKGKVVQGGAIQTYPFEPNVASVSVLLKTDGRPLNSRVELLQGPNNNKQVIEVYTEDGYERPFFMVVATPGSGNVVRLCNTATVEFPMTVAVDAFLVDETFSDVQIGGAANNFFFSKP